MSTEDPFPELKTADTSALDKANCRVHCSLCGRKRMYFCYGCIVYVNGLESFMPTVKLPIKVDIIKHKQELDSKSTAVHAALLAPDHCTIYTYPDIPDYSTVNAVLVFPSEDSISLEQWSSLHPEPVSESQAHGPPRAVFIDCTWNQIHSIIHCPQLAGLPRIRMSSYTTKFWRPNGANRGADHLATIEALYYFLKEYHTLHLRRKYDGEYDNLLMIFKYMYMKIKDYHYHRTSEDS